MYDVIVIDTPPSLSYVTINALWAADGLVVPVPPSGLDFASSAQFWSLLSDLGLTGQAKILLGENDAETTVLQLLQSGVSDGEELLSASQLEASDLSTTLTMLEIRGLIYPLGGNRWRI